MKEMEKMDGIEGMVTGYLTRRNTAFVKSGDTYSVRWLDDSSAFAEGWAVEVIHDEFFDGLLSTVTYKIRGVENDALLEEKWMEVSERHQGVSFLGGVSDRSLKGEAVLSCGELIESHPSELKRSLDCSFRTVLDAVYSLMSLYEKEYLHMEGDLQATRFSRSAKVGFQMSCLTDPGPSETAAEERVRQVPPPSVEVPRKVFVFKEPDAEPELDFGKKRGFSSIAGMEDLKREMRRKVLWPLSHRSKAEEYRIRMPSGMLLYGPPGCGKSFFAEKFAEESGYRYRMVSPSELGCKYLHGSQELIAGVFEDARKNAPCVLCLDEIDAMVPTRESQTGENRRDEVNEFLVQLNNAGDDGVFVIGTTNRRDMIDQAALRSGRFDIQVEVPAPDARMRESLFRYELQGRPVSDDVDIARLSVMTEGYACSDIAAIVNEAAIDAAISGEPISRKHLCAAAAATKPSLGQEGCRTRIGFGTGGMTPVTTKA